MKSIYDAIAEPNRRAILTLLIASQLSVADLQGRLGLAQTAVSKHLRVLREAGLVEAEIRGPQRIYRLAPDRLRELDDWIAPFRQLWHDRFDALERHLNSSAD